MRGFIGTPESKEQILALGGLNNDVGCPEELVVNPKTQYSDRVLLSVRDGAEGGAGVQVDGEVRDCFM